MDDLETDHSSMSLSGSVDLPEFNLSQSTVLQKLSTGQNIVASLEKTLVELKGLLSRIKKEKVVSQTLGMAIESIVPSSLSSKVTLKSLTQKPSRVGFDQVVVTLEEIIKDKETDLSRALNVALKDYSVNLLRGDAITYIINSYSLSQVKHKDFQSFDTSLLKDTLGVACNSYTLDLICGKRSVQVLYEDMAKDQSYLTTLMTLIHDALSHFTEITEERVSYIEKVFDTQNQKPNVDVLMKIQDVKSFIENEIEALPNPDNTDWLNCISLEVIARVLEDLNSYLTPRKTATIFSQHLGGYDQEAVEMALKDSQKSVLYGRLANLIYRLMDVLYLHYLQYLSIYRSCERLWFATHLFYDTLDYA